MLAAGKGWVLAMLAMLGPKPGLRVAARGCAWLRSRRQAAPPLPSAARRGDLEGVGTKGVPPHRRQEGLPARRRTKG